MIKYEKQSLFTQVQPDLQKSLPIQFQKIFWWNITLNVIYHFSQTSPVVIVIYY